MTPPVLTLVPPEPVPATPADKERAQRAEMLRALQWEVATSAPPWREVLFLGKPKEFKIPRVPPAVIERIRDLKKESFAPDEAGIKALGIAEGMHAGLPAGAVPRSIAAARALSPSRDSVSGWNRRSVLTAVGPAIIPLLVSANYLTPGDVEFLDTTYPAETKEQRLAAVEAAGAVGQAARRAGRRGALPVWLDDQLLTLMDEERDTAHFVEMYEQEKQAAEQPAPQGAGVGAGGESKIANQFRPQPSPGSLP